MATKQSTAKKGQRKKGQTAKTPADPTVVVDDPNQTGQPTAPTPQSGAPVPDVAPAQPPKPDVVIMPAPTEEGNTGLVDPRVLRPGPTA